jgi:hypothetical protein
VDDPGPLGRVLNIGGEGEMAYAIDVNNLIEPSMPPTRFVRRGWFIQGDATALPVRSGVADEVTGNRFPAGNDEDWRQEVAAEAFRVLVPGGRFRIWSVAGGGAVWLSSLSVVGFAGVTLEAGYAWGVKP